MVASDVNIAAAALAIALVAVVVAVGQIFQQYYATAEGARRCQSSVVGRWHKETRWHFRWKELRFEILFKSPHVVIDQGNNDFGPLKSLKLPSEKRTAAISYPTKEKTSPGQVESDELVCWIPLLEELLKLESYYRIEYDRKTGQGVVHTPSFIPSGLPCHPPWYPSVQIRQRSWDLIPPEMVRPYASSTVGDVLVWCHRLGMTWQEINPSKGILQAQGEGYSLSSTLVRGFGVLAYFSRDKAAPQRNLVNLWAPTLTADSFAFGICPCDEGLEIPDLNVSSGTKILELVSQWDHSQGKKFLKMHQEERDRGGLHGRIQYGFTVVIGVMAPYLLASQIPIFRAPYPQPALWHEWSSPEEWWVFRYRLQAFLKREGSASQTYQQLRWIDYQLDALAEHAAYADSGVKTESSRDFKLRERFETLHASTREYIKKFNRMDLGEPVAARKTYWIVPERYSNFYELLKSFACLSIERRRQAKDRLEKQGPTNTYGMSFSFTPILTEMGHLHWEKLHELVEDMRYKGFHDPSVEKEDSGGRKVTLDEVVTEAWATMMFRHLLFHRTTKLGPQGTIKPEFRNSKIPVYIG